VSKRRAACRDELERLELADLRTLIRAFTVFFDLVNLAEQRAAIRVLRVAPDRPTPYPSRKVSNRPCDNYGFAV
jgi:phosphoenolpyruvate carboxylase